MNFQAERRKQKAKFAPVIARRYDEAILKLLPARLSLRARLTGRAGRHDYCHCEETRLLSLRGGTINVIARRHDEAISSNPLTIEIASLHSQ